MEMNVELGTHTIEDLKRNFDKHLENCHWSSEPTGLYQPVEYILKLGGKRQRPVLVLTACELFGGDMESALDAALAIEIFHNFTLVHDDVMDNAFHRRGQATVHEKYSLNHAILSGDVMMLKAIHLLNSLSADCVMEILRVFNDSAIRLCEGQQMDMNFEQETTVDAAEYLKMISMKTGALIEAALVIGGLIGGCNQKQKNELQQLGYALGLAFQIRDDLLDAFGDEHKTGKMCGGDILNNKKTLLNIITRESKGNEIDKLLFSSLSPQDKITTVKLWMEQTGARAYVEEQVEHHHSNAVRIIDGMTVPEENKLQIRRIANRLVDRDH